MESGWKKRWAWRADGGGWVLGMEGEKKGLV
jgi:hypothetical protein